MNRALTVLSSALLLGLLVACTVTGLPSCQQTSSFVTQTGSSLPVTGVLVTLAILSVSLLVLSFGRDVLPDATRSLSLTRLRHTPVVNGITSGRPYRLNRVFLL